MDGETLKVLLAGATGVVGGHVLARLLAEPRISTIVAPTRRPIPTHPRLVNPVVDFFDLPPDAPWWAVHGVISCLGTTQRIAGSRDAFRAVDHGCAMAVVRLARAAGATRFALTSSLGADPSAHSFYLRTKGEIERDLMAVGFPSLTFAWPGFLAGPRPERMLPEALAKAVLSLLGPALPAHFRLSLPERVGQALVDAVLVGRTGCHVISSECFA